jgi:serine/threonine protein kinase
MDLSPRAVIAGRYRVDTKVGAGGMGEVWLGETIPPGQRVAVKTLLPAAAMNHEVVARFKREAYILGRIHSENVARVLDFVPDDLYGLVLVMEFVEGDPLSRLLQERTLTVEEGIDLAFGLATALKDLHGANIIHRDLKPGNIMMTPMSEGRRRAVVVDFGVSRVMSEKDKDEDEELTGITRADMAVGTIEYMAPEQILNSRNVTPGSDLYAAGAMLFRSCAGRHVFGNVASDAELAQKKLTTESPPLPLNRTDALAEGFAKVVAKMVKRRPSERYKTADEVIADLKPLLPAQRSGAELDGETVDGKGPPPATTMTAPAATAAKAAAAPAAPASTPAPASAPDPGQPSSSSDIRISISSAPTIDNAAAPRRGVSPVVTLGLVVAALAGGVLIGPRLAQQSATPVTSAATTASTPVSAAPPPASVTPPPPPTATVEATTADPTATPDTAASAPTPVAATASATASAAPPADAGAGRAVPTGRVPGPLPRSPIIAPSLPLSPPPGRVEPTQL